MATDFKNFPDNAYFLTWIFCIINRPTSYINFKYIPIPNENTCFCCRSITCSKNWAPFISFTNILREYTILKTFSIYCSSLMQRRLKSIFINDKWSINDDIIKHIMKFIIPDSSDVPII